MSNRPATNSRPPTIGRRPPELATFIGYLLGIVVVLPLAAGETVLPLLRGRVEIDRVVLYQPAIELGDIIKGTPAEKAGLKPIEDVDVRFDPNIQRVRATVNGTPQRLNVCTGCLKAGKVTR